jgi:predicted  nucleic acid-binding Zn-ribbon protein
MVVREVAFELECFEWADERLEVAGRWKGLAGRRLARPVLTVDTESGRRKRLLAIPGGHFGTAGESWRAAFDWPGDPAEITAAELEVGGNVVVDLPLPDRRRRRRKRPAADPGDEALHAEVVALRAQVERLRSELAGRERENMQLRAELEEESEADEPADGASSSTVEIERLEGEREQLTVELERLAQERDRTHSELAAEIERLQGERKHWRTQIDELREAFSDAAAEAEATRDHHRAELAAAEELLAAARAEVARLTAELARRADAPPPATEWARRSAAAAPPTEPMPPPTGEDRPAPSARGGESTQSMPPVTEDSTEAPATRADREESSMLVDAASAPGALDAPGPLRAGGRPASQPGVDESPRGSRIPEWLRSRSTSGRENGSGEPVADAELGPSAAAFVPAGENEPAAADPETAGRPSAALQALKARLEGVLAPNGHAAVEEHEDAAEAAVPRPRRTAAAARARAGATVAARRSAAELWALRVLAALLVIVLLIAFLLILTSVA